MKWYVSSWLASSSSSSFADFFFFLGGGFAGFELVVGSEEEEALALPFALEVAAAEALASFAAVLEASSVASARVWRTSLISAGLDHTSEIIRGKYENE